MNDPAPNQATKPGPVLERPTISHAELPEGRPESPLCQEWNVYRREVGRLLAEGREGAWVVIKGTEVVGIYATWEEARGTAVQRYLLQPVLVKQVLAREPILRIRGYNLPCPPSLSP
jgi:hypothetical protein